MIIEATRKPWPLGLLLFGLILLSLGLFDTYTGKTHGKGRSVERAKEPIEYWLTILVEYLGGAFLIWGWINTLQQ